MFNNCSKAGFLWTKLCHFPNLFVLQLQEWALGRKKGQVSAACLIPWLRCAGFNMLHLTLDQKVGSEAGRVWCQLSVSLCLSQPVASACLITSDSSTLSCCNLWRALPDPRGQFQQCWRCWGQRCIHKGTLPVNSVSGEDGGSAAVSVPSMGGMALGQQSAAFPAVSQSSRYTEHIGEFKSESLCDLFSFSKVSSLTRSHSSCCECCFNGAIRKTGLPCRTGNQKCWNRSLTVAKIIILTGFKR